ncbi:MAG: PIG-L family deacetylase [Firmicutes bacterium]|nr:PIG-L family deacetylase [Bacillota bacterium]
MKLRNQHARLFFPATSGGNLADTTHLCIAAHQDDIELMAAGAILECYGQNDKHFTGVVVTDGAGSPRTGIYANCSDEDMKVTRANEQDNAASIGGYNAQFQLYYPSSAVKDNANPHLVDELVDIILATQPEYVFTHNFADKHDTHCAVAARTLQALRKIPADKRPKAVYSMEVWRALDWVCDTEKKLFDTSRDEFLQAAMLGVYHSQIAGGKRYDLAGLGRKRANATYFASHATDDFEAAEYALDITQLMNDESLCPAAFINNYIEMFKNDVNKRVGMFI